jgi:hypothetical protein
MSDSEISGRLGYRSKELGFLAACTVWQVLYASGGVSSSGAMTGWCPELQLGQVQNELVQLALAC